MRAERTGFVGVIRSMRSSFFFFFVLVFLSLEGKKVWSAGCFSFKKTIKKESFAEPESVGSGGAVKGSPSFLCAWGEGGFDSILMLADGG